MNSFEFDWGRVWLFMLIGVPMAVVRTFISQANRTWDSLLANVVAACVVSPAAGVAMISWLDNPATPQLEGLPLSFVSATAVAFLGVDLLRGMLNVGEAFAKNPVSLLTTFYSVWTGKGKRDD